MNKTALVTGHKGFIGRHMFEALLKDGWTVAGCDIKDGLDQDCRRVFKTTHKYDLVVHCAAVVGGKATIDYEPLKVAVDFAIDADFFQYINRVKPGKSIYFSSSAAYPTHLQAKGTRTQLTEWMVPPYRDLQIFSPDGIYGHVKVVGEMLAALSRQQGVDVTVFRPFSGYGSDQDLDYPFPSFIQRAVRREDPFTVWGSGEQIRDWIHISDIVAAVMRAIDMPPMTANICTGRGMSMLDVIRTILDQTGFNPDIEPMHGTPVGVWRRVGSPYNMNAFYTAKVSLEEGVALALEDSQTRRTK